jgi:hypothetical protein
MKRLHIHVAVESIESSVTFYTAMFGVVPTVQKTDYAKWMLDDPRVNFAISSRNQTKGLDHFGIQAENIDELKEIYTRMKSASPAVFDQGSTQCCYAESEKSWVHDPQGLPWEAFLTTGISTVYGSSDSAPAAEKSACCAPVAAKLTQFKSFNEKRSGDDVAKTRCC